MNEWTEWSKRELLKLPRKFYNNFTEKDTFDGVLLVPTQRKHDSGYNLFCLVECYKRFPKYIIGFCDCFELDPSTNTKEQIRIDCSMKGVFRVFSNKKLKLRWLGSTTSFSISTKGE